MRAKVGDYVMIRRIKVPCIVTRVDDEGIVVAYDKYINVKHGEYEIVYAEELEW